MRGHEPKKNALLARTLVRTIIARYQTNNAVDPRSLMFKKNMYGKPEVKQFINCQWGDYTCSGKYYIQFSSRLWTLKEAYVKAVGKGFSAAPFNTFRIQSKAGTKGGYKLCKTSEMTVRSLENTKNCYREWKFALLELADSHYAAICTEDDEASGGAPMRVIVRKDIPFVEDGTYF